MPCSERLVPCRTFAAVPGLCLLDADSVPRLGQSAVSADLAHCPWVGKPLPGEGHCSNTLTTGRKKPRPREVTFAQSNTAVRGGGAGARLLALGSQTGVQCIANAAADAMSMILTKGAPGIHPGPLLPLEITEVLNARGARTVHVLGCAESRERLDSRPQHGPSPAQSCTENTAFRFGSLDTWTQQ